MNRPLLTLFNNKSKEEFLEIYKDWQDSVVIDDIDFVDFRLVPKVYETARTLGFDRNLRLENILKYWWLKSNLINAFLESLDEALSASDVKYAILLKGAAICQEYEKPYHRAMGDVDVLVDFDDVHKLDKILHNLRCELRKNVVDIDLTTLENEPEFSKVFRKTLVYKYKDMEVDVHWNLPAMMCNAQKERLIANAQATSFQFFKKPTFAFQIAMLIIHGQHRVTDKTNLNWVNDLDLLLCLIDENQLKEVVMLVKEDDRVSHVHNKLLFAKKFISPAKLDQLIFQLENLGLKKIQPKYDIEDFYKRSRYFLLKSTQSRIGKKGDKPSVYFAWVFCKNQWINFKNHKKSLYAFKKLFLNTLGASLFVIKNKKTDYDYFV